MARSVPIAYLNGRMVLQSQAAVPLSDAGFVLGATVTEQLRTFGGKLFRPAEHWQRLAQSLEIVGVDAGLSLERLNDVASEVVERNLTCDPPGGELGLGIFITPGPYATLAAGSDTGPTVCVYSYALPFHLWAAAYDAGVKTVISSVRQVPGDCWPAELKCRSRMHYYLADREAARKQPGAKAILLDHDGCLSETSTANLLLHFPDRGLVSPPSRDTLAGITLDFVGELAGQLGIALARRPVPAEEIEAADELMLTSTPSGILPVVECDGRSIGAGRPGPVYRKLLAAFSAAVGVDVARQAMDAAAG